MTAINVGDLVKVRNGPTGVVRGIEGLSVQIEPEDGDLLYCRVSDVARVDGDRLMADTLAAGETTELPPNLFEPAQLPQLNENYMPRRHAVTPDERHALLQLLECVLSLDPAQLAELSLPELLERVERIRAVATNELLRLVQSRLSAMGPEPARTPVVGRRGR